MAIEIEKKYRLTEKQRAEALKRLPKIGARRIREDFEVNTLYAGEKLDLNRSVLRLRQVGKRATLTYKERFRTRSDVKRQRENETSIDDPVAMAAILADIGFTPSLVYEKRREVWRFEKTEVVIDELPFGLFMEIEGSEKEIRSVETKLAVKSLKVESDTYPQLARKHGDNVGDVIEARFSKTKRKAASTQSGRSRNS